MTESSEAKEPYSSESGTTPTAFSSLRITNFRLMAVSYLISNSGYWMKYTALSWLVLSLTGSAAAVGLTSALLFMPTLVVGMSAGVMADR